MRAMRLADVSFGRTTSPAELEHTHGLRPEVLSLANSGATAVC